MVIGVDTVFHWPVETPHGFKQAEREYGVGRVVGHGRRRLHRSRT
jgi:hypothetical protein